MYHFKKTLFLLGLFAAWSANSANAAPPGSLITPPPQAGIRLAQFKFEPGASREDMIQRLRRAGYSKIEITQSRFTKIRANACFKGTRYHIVLYRLDGRIQRGGVVGECRQELSPRQVRAKLKARGFRRISVTEHERGGFVASVCRSNRRLRLRINAYGKIRRQKETGLCQRALDYADIRQSLRGQGYDRIKLIRKGRKRFVLAACRGRDRLRLTINSRGRIVATTTAGECALPIKPKQIAAIVSYLGYDRIKVTDRTLPGYGAQACRGTALSQIRMNRFGEVHLEKVIGECAPPLNHGQIVRLLRQQGAKRIRVKAIGKNRGYQARACLKRNLYSFSLDRYGNILKRKLIDRCESPVRIDQVMNKFKKRGVSQMKFFVQGCDSNRLVRFEIDKFGKVKNELVLGGCRR